MTRLACLILLAALSLLSLRAAAAILQPVAVCYAVQPNGNVETTYVNVPSSGAYPIESSGSIEQTETGFIARHQVTFEWRVMRVYLPVVSGE